MPIRASRRAGMAPGSPRTLARFERGRGFAGMDYACLRGAGLAEPLTSELLSATGGRGFMLEERPGAAFIFCVAELGDSTGFWAVGRARAKGKPLCLPSPQEGEEDYGDSKFNPDLADP